MFTEGPDVKFCYSSRLMYAEEIPDESTTCLCLTASQKLSNEAHMLPQYDSREFSLRFCLLGSTRYRVLHCIETAFKKAIKELCEVRGFAIYLCALVCLSAIGRQSRSGTLTAPTLLVSKLIDPCIKSSTKVRCDKPLYHVPLSRKLLTLTYLTRVEQHRLCACLTIWQLQRLLRSERHCW